MRCRNYKYNYGYSFSENVRVELHQWKFIPDNNEITFELNKPGKILNIWNGITDVTECFERIDYTYMTTLKYIGDLSIACGQMPDDGYELIIRGQELLAPCGIYSTGLIDDNISGEVVTIDCPLCSNYTQAEALAQNFILETLLRDEFEIEVKRNMLWECGDVLELEKPIWGSDGTAKVPCRLIEDKKSLTSVRQKLKLRKISLDETV